MISCPVFDVRSVNGGRCVQVFGPVGTAIIPNISTTDAERIGTHSKPAAAVRRAGINGLGPHACVVVDGRGTRIGTSERNSYLTPLKYTLG